MPRGDVPSPSAGSSSLRLRLPVLPPDSTAAVSLLGVFVAIWAVIRVCSAVDASVRLWLLCVEVGVSVSAKKSNYLARLPFSRPDDEVEVEVGCSRFAHVTTLKWSES